MTEREWATLGFGFCIAMWLSLKLLGYIQDRAGPEWQSTCNWTRYWMFVLTCLVGFLGILWLYFVPALTAVLV